MRVARAEDPVEQLGDRVGDGRCKGAALKGPAPHGRVGWGPGGWGRECEGLTEEVHHAEDDGGAGRADGEAVADAGGLGDDSGGGISRAGRGRGVVVLTLWARGDDMLC